MSCKNLFRFKKFDVCQDGAAMKIGTDGVLLGAWVKTENPYKILDIGAGNGLISLMMAQRFPDARIECVEIDAKASKQAQENIRRSPWKSRIKIYNQSLQDFIPEGKFDLIVSNPPFFEENVRAKTFSRQIARQNISLSLEDIFSFVQKYIHKQGSFQMIFPKSKETILLKTAQAYGLFPRRITNVQGKDSGPVKRILIAFYPKIVKLKLDGLVIEKLRHQYTSEYIKLTKDFYLKM